jgi:dihydrofolate reductase
VGDTPYPVPCFVLTHRPRAPLAMKSGTLTFVADGIVSALDQARVAAGGRDIMVMGANAAQQYLKAGLCDEMLLQLALVLLGAGTRLFDHLGGQIELTRTRLIGSPFVTHMKFDVAKRQLAPP